MYCTGFYTGIGAHDIYMYEESASPVTGTGGH